MKKQQLKEALKSEIRKVLKEDNINETKTSKIKLVFEVDSKAENFGEAKGIENSLHEALAQLIYEDNQEGGDWLNENVLDIQNSSIKETTELDEMARIAKTIKISDLEKAQAVIDKVKDTKKKWIADMIQKVIDAGDEGIAQVSLAKALGKVDEFGDGRQQAINPEVRSLLGGDVFTFGAAKVADKPEVTDVTTDDEDEIITSVPDETEDEEEIDITNDDVEDSEDEDETEADKFLKSDEEETEDDEEVAKKATPNKRIGSKADQLDAVITDMKKLAADYKKAKTDGDKDKEKEIADKLKEKTKLKKELEKDINISLGDEDEDEL